MKRKSIVYAAVAALLLAGCNGGTELKTDFYEAEATEAVAEGALDSIRVSVSLEYPVGGTTKEALDHMTRLIIGKGMDSEDTDIAKAVDAYIQTTVANYRETNAELYEEMGEDAADQLAWVDELRGFFSDRYKDIATYTLKTYTESGGPHGDNDIYYMNLNVTDGNLVTEKDLFKEGYEAKLNTLLTSHLREALPDEESYESLFVKDIEANGNFRVSPEGLYYIYVAYEIGPYYLGAIEVMVPWSELEDILA